VCLPDVSSRTYVFQIAIASAFRNEETKDSGARFTKERDERETRVCNLIAAPNDDESNKVPHVSRNDQHLE